jgi:transcriptional regulator of NAD metabolism
MAKEKARLQNVMAYGKDLEPPKAVASSRPQVKDEEEIDRFAEVMGEIEERRKFLEDMAALGQDKPHRHKIMTEISQVCKISEGDVEN